MTRVLGWAPLRRMLLVVGAVFVALPVSSAMADTTIGETGGTVSCSPGTGTVAADTNYVVTPVAGRITSFSFQSTAENTGDRIDFLVLRPAPVGPNYIVVGKTGVVRLKGTGTQPETFSASPSIPVQAHDIIGFWVAAPDKSPFFPNCLRAVVGSGGVVASGKGAPDPLVGDAVNLTNEVGGVDLNESANLTQVAITKSECMNGGWLIFGTMFKSQGDCVSYVSKPLRGPS